MNKFLFGGLLLAIAGAASAGSVTGAYSKTNGEILIAQDGGQAAFYINSVVDMHPCQVGSDEEPEVANIVDEHRAVWTSEDAEDRCVILLTFSPSMVTVKTKDCDSYCGMNAIGSMDGSYQLSK